MSHYHRDENGFLHKCITWGKIIAAAIAIDVAIEVLTFKPVHDIFHAMGWI